MLPRLIEMQAAVKAFDAAITAAMAQALSRPAAGLPMLDAVLDQLPVLRHDQLDLWAALPDPPFSRAECAGQWREKLIAVLLSRQGAANMLADPDQLAQTRAAIVAALADAPDDPQWAYVWEQDAQQADDPDESARLFDQAFARRLETGDALGAARNRMQAASSAAASGRMAQTRRCGEQALAIARAHDLRRDLIQFRISSFQSLLVADQAGAARQELKAELDYVSDLRGSLPDALRQVYGDGLAALEGPDAAHVADAFGLVGQARALREGQPDARDAAVAALAAQRDQQTLSLLLLASQFKGALGDWDTPAESILPRALRLAKSPDELGRVYGAMADAAEANDQVPAAIAAMEHAVSALKSGLSATALAQAESRLAALRADGEGIPYDPAMHPDDYAVRRSAEAVTALRAGQFARALAILDSLAAVACSDLTRGNLALMRGVALYEMDRPAEAEPVFTLATTVFEPALAIDPEGEGEWLGQREAALLFLAATLTRLGRPHDAWIAAERARAPRLARQLGIAEPDWPSLRDTLRVRRAAVLTIQALRWGTLVMSAAPGEAEPQAVLLPCFRAADVTRLLSRDLGDDSDAWTGVLMAAIPDLSAGLGAPLAGRLRELAARAEVLYLIPDAALWYAPWAAVELEAGVPLAELIPFALLPFARLLPSCTAGAGPSRTALAMAVGGDSAEVPFTGHLDMLKPRFAPYATTWLRDDAATAQALHDAAPPGLLYLSCHGTIDHATPLLDQSSRLMLAGPPLPSGTLAGWRLGPGLDGASITFLNACQTGRFRPATRTELGGFPAAFLRAGRRLLIAPLTHVEPGAACKLADGFFAALPASGPAAALRQARLALRAAGAPPSDWAAHTMFGPDG